MVTVIIVITILLLCVPAFLAFFRAEGLAALYILGLPLVFFVVEKLHIPWSTVMTGACYPILFIPCMLWWWLARKDNPLDPPVPRSFNLSVVIIFSLVFLWEAKHWFERSYLSPDSAHEYYKWAYMIARWGVPFLMGIAFPLTIVRLRRFLGACSVLGLMTSVVILASYLTGQRDFSEWGARYSPMQRMGGLSIAISCGLGAAAMLAYLFLMNEIRKSARRNILIGAGVTFSLLVILLSGSRGPVLALFLAFLLFLLLLGTRGTLRMAVALAISGVILFFAWSLLPQTALNRVFGTYGQGGGFGAGMHTRWELVRSSFNILSVSPAFGQTLQLRDVIGIDYSHNFTLQFLVELGLIGLTMYIIAFVPPILRLLRAAFKRGTYVRAVAGALLIMFAEAYTESHASGDISATGVWLVLGMVMGHRLRVGPAQDRVFLEEAPPGMEAFPPQVAHGAAT